MLMFVTYCSVNTSSRDSSSRFESTLYFLNAATVCLFVIHGSASTVVLRLARPRFSASLCHSSPSPSKTTCLLFAHTSLTTAVTAFSRVAPDFLSCVVSLLERSSTDSATIVFRTVFGNEGELEDPSARNSNLLPVNANGLVRLRSPPCMGIGGSTGVPRPRNEP